MQMLSTFLFCFVHDDVIKWKHIPRYWPFVRGIDHSPVNSPHKDQWREALVFSLICKLSQQSWDWWFETPSCSLWRRAITWTDAELLSIGPLETNFSKIRIKIRKFSFMKMQFQMSFAKWQPFCPQEDQLNAANHSKARTVCIIHGSYSMPTGMYIYHAGSGLTSGCPRHKHVTLTLIVSARHSCAFSKITVWETSRVPRSWSIIWHLTYWSIIYHLTYNVAFNLFLPIDNMAFHPQSMGKVCLNMPQLVICHLGFSICTILK